MHMKYKFIRLPVIWAACEEADELAMAKELLNPEK